jgi:hypothetical protein
MGLFMHDDGRPSPFRRDIERLVNNGAIFAGLGEDEKQQAIVEIDRLLACEITIGIATWGDWWTEKSEADRKLSLLAIKSEAIKAFDELGYKH